MRFPSVQVVRDAAVLTGTYVAGNGTGAENDVDISGANQIVLFLTITMGALDSIELRAEVALASGDRFQEASAAACKGVAFVRPLEYSIRAVDLTGGAGALYLPIPVLGDKVRISAKGTGTTTGSSLTISAATRDV
jgi:hypothetical protein